MASSKATSVSAYLDELPPDRREAIVAVRKVILKNLPKGFVEGMAYGVIGYMIPLATYPETYNGQPLMYAGLASQKNYMSFYLTNVYGHKETEVWFRKRWAATGKKLDMGKSCVRFKKLDDLPLDLIGETIARTSVKDLIRFVEDLKAKK
jgi:hypothetical protein